jgi:hypothetical protein
MLYPSHAHHWWPLIEDVFMSNHVKEIGENIFKSLERNGEFLSLSVDATLKVCTTIQGQASHRAPAAVRNAACFDDESSLRRVLTIRGRTGAVVGMVPISHEDANRVAATFTSHLSPIALAQVKFVASDSPSLKLFREIKAVCRHLQCISLDPVHLAIVYEYAQWGKKSAGSRVLRHLLKKCGQQGLSKSMDSWGPFFSGLRPAALSREEEQARQKILDGSMSQARAKRILEALDANTPLLSRITFVETLAAICTCFPNEVSRRVTGTNKEVRKILWAAAAPDRMEWLFNNLRVRHAMTPAQRALLPSGTSSNEALHAEINAWSRTNHALHQSTLRLKLQIMQFGKLVAHHAATCFPTIKQCSESVLLARCLASEDWPDEKWKACCKGTEKAHLPLHKDRVQEAAQVRQWNAANVMKVRKHHVKKRTVHTVRRHRSIRSAGVKIAPKRNPMRA